MSARKSAAPGELTAAILWEIRHHPGCRVRDVIATLQPVGFNAHSIRTQLTTLVNGGAVTCDRKTVPARYTLAEDPQGKKPLTDRVLQALADAPCPMTSGELIAKFKDVAPSFAIRNALFVLQGSGKVGRMGRLHHYRYFPAARNLPAAAQLAAATKSLLAHGVATPEAMPAIAPEWPAMALENFGMPAIGWRGLEPVGAAA